LPRVYRQGRAAAQPERHRRPDTTRCPGGFHWRLRIGKVFVGFRDSLCRSTAPVPGFGGALCQASVRPDRHSGSGHHRRSAARSGASATARISHHSISCRQCNDRFQPASDAVFTRGHISRGSTELHGEAFSTNTPEGACPRCHRIGRVYDATEKTMVPDDSMTIRQRAIAAWPPAWGGQNQRDILVTLWLRCRSSLPRPSQEGSGLDSFHRRPTHGTGVCRIHSGGNPPSPYLKGKEEPSYLGTFTGVRRYLLHGCCNSW
jgi:phage FluMu protein Com